MDGMEPSAAAMQKARADQQESDRARTENVERTWRRQGRDIEEGMADAVARAAAMGDHVEPSTLPPERRPGRGNEGRPTTRRQETERSG
jgi:hypothetical protein